MTHPRTAVIYNALPSGELVSVTFKQSHPELIGVDREVTITVDLLVGVVGHLLYLPRANEVGHVEVKPATHKPPILTQQPRLL